MNQEQTNQAWKQTIQPERGPSITILVPPVRNSGLRKPYQYQTTTAEFRKLKQDAKTIAEQFGNNLQCAGVDSKPVTYGARLDIFLLGYKPGHTGTTTGVTRAQWEKVTTELCDRLKQSLGEDIAVYIEPWTAERKFQARFETYIMFEELQP